MRSQAEKCAIFRGLHERNRAFVIPNPWDIGALRLLEQLGFEALATTSAGYAQSIGKADGAVERDAMIAHAGVLAAASDLPVSADLENGYADDPAGVAETIRLAAAAGLAGCSIEDLPVGRNGEPYDIDFAVERVRVAAAAAHALPFPFMLTARAENFIAGRPDLVDTIARLKAFADAGADVVYAPGVVDREHIAAVVKSVDRPVNVLAGLPGMKLTLKELSDLGVRRISIGSGLSSAAYNAARSAAAEISERGTFTLLSAR
jgi:2-methylisocitrate lyase-like PEP mutase family enzyme